jgi:hypothetical protein
VVVRVIPGHVRPARVADQTVLFPGAPCSRSARKFTADDREPLSAVIEGAHPALTGEAARAVREAALEHQRAEHLLENPDLGRWSRHKARRGLAAAGDRFDKPLLLGEAPASPLPRASKASGRGWVRRSLSSSRLAHLVRSSSPSTPRCRAALPKYRNYCAYSIGCFIVWAIILTVRVVFWGGSSTTHTVLSVFAGWCIAWISTTIAM